MTAPATARITAVRWRPFRLPLQRPVDAAHGTIDHREGVVLELRDSDGVSGIGEASPIPSLGGGSHGDVLRLLDRYSGRWLERSPANALVALPVRGRGAAAMRCALDCASLDIEAQRRGVPVAALLARTPTASVQANAVIGGGAPDEVAARAQEAVAAGYTVLKLKVGVSPLDADLAAVDAVRRACPEAVIRVDANGAWEEPAAVDAINALAGRAELVEQPVPAADVEALARLRERATVPIAADEALASESTADRVLELRAADVLVLKPMMLGGLRPAADLARRAAAAGIESFATTTFDSSVGAAAALHLAAALPWTGAHGLGTGDHLAADIVAETLRPTAGHLDVPGPGLGVALDERALDGVATAAWREATA